MAMFLMELMISLLVLLICLGLIAACGYVVIQSWLYVKKTFNLGKKKFQKTIL